MEEGAWNHNIHYHDLVLERVPANCGRALDVGCGQGLLARQLLGRCEEVVAIDSDAETLEQARSAGGSARITFVEGDAMTYPFPNGSFDFIAAVASLHHLPLAPALERFKNLLRSGGVLAVVGLYRSQTISDYAWSTVGLSASRLLRCVRRHVEPGAPVQEPRESLREIREVCHALLPGAVVTRHLLFRYSLIWRKA